MAAYVLVDVEITNQEAYEKYREVAYPVINAFGGKYLVRGGATEVIEGDWSFDRLIIVEFESVERARQWYYSPEYRPAIDVIEKYARRKLAIVEGVAE
ncbi:DUF1330 domain-containing protein [Caballeronia insecticola]|nr:DUF1330 domain-containing protein [Caballeronia insecticola]